ncbi:MAG: RlmE family RNA methyltransferase [Holosporales bacterium]|jgi:23S rRNA (uridine2552-2'-O)-methyltransferase|nr:RlmE family RNA methyltransferase [Holosporales bacterium]
MKKVISLASKKKRTPSSRKWLLRQLNDRYVHMSKQQGYRSRSAYKLLEIDDKFRILAPKQLVVDLGCAPGGWLQVAKQRVRNGCIIGVDLQEVAPLDEVTVVTGDFTATATVQAVVNILGGRKVNVVLSDLAAASCGMASVDHIRIMSLVRAVFDFCVHTLDNGGSMVAKVLRGGTENLLLAEIKKKFARVAHFKPQASRCDSSEMYIVAIGYRPDHQAH